MLLLFYYYYSILYIMHTQHKGILTLYDTHTSACVIIIQQEAAIAELKEHAGLTSSDTVCATQEYLSACHLIFERGILNKEICVKKPDGLIVQRMDEGFLYFTRWLDGLLQQGTR